MSVQASTISSAWAPSRLVLPVKPYSVARNLVRVERIKDGHPEFLEFIYWSFYLAIAIDWASMVLLYLMVGS